MYEYANRMQARGHQVTVIHPRNQLQQTGAAQNIKSRLWKFKNWIKYRPLIGWFDINPLVRLSMVPDLREIFIPDGDIIFATAHNTSFPVAGYSPAKGRKYYLVQSYETWQGSEDRVKSSWKLPLNKIVVSRWLLKIAQELDETHRSTYIPLGLNFEQFRVTKPIKERTSPRIGMLAHPHEIKGTKDGLIALNIVREKIPSLQARLFGTHPQTGDIPDWMEYQQLPGVEQLRDLYNSCSIFLHPSRIEGWGLPAAEAMACGCALVAAANDGVFEFAVDGENALIAPVKNPGALATHLFSLLEDDALRIRLAETGQRQIQRFGWDNAVDSLEQLLITHSIQ